MWLFLVSGPDLQQTQERQRSDAAAVQQILHRQERAVQELQQERTSLQKLPRTQSEH